ncbi:hypothetical protein WR25_23393 [Diploscapter pachys]|uniref:Exocyst complex component Sec3 PIP2-binding N-terminal domain-containing protein n=1 Tax=Diploscapter pachys TaxID=2018661 RepID=A0A2A2J542_9BILA|nr:hypothetical protein WR25_23393 [Diploscapter pachys]
MALTAIRKDVQQKLFVPDDERLHSILNLVKVDGKKKKHTTFLLTTEHPISVRIYFVKTDKDDSYKKKERFHLRDVREVDGINPKKAIVEFYLTMNDRRYQMTAATSEEKDEFIRELRKLAAQYLPVQMPEFFNVPLHEDRPDVDIIPVETKEDFEYPDIKDMQLTTAKEETDFRRMLTKTEFTLAEVDKFSEMLNAELQSLDGANIQTMLGSEVAVNSLIAIIDAAMDTLREVEEEVDSYNDILANVRKSMDIMDEKDSLVVVERRNKEKLQVELHSFLSAMDAVTTSHIRTLNEANFNDAASIARCSEAARAVSQFWHGKVPKALVQMKAYQEKNKGLAVIDMFVDRLKSHLSALFQNLSNMDYESDGTWTRQIPKQTQRFRALMPLGELTGWLKANRPKHYNASIVQYVTSTRELYKRLFDTFFDNLIAEVQRLGLMFLRWTENSLFVLGASNVSRVSSERSTVSAVETTDFSQLSHLIETMLGELNPIIEAEQRFFVRFFHINAELLAHAETTSTGSGDSSSVGGKSTERVMNDQVRGYMSQLFEPLNPQLDRFCRAVCKQGRSNVLLLFVAASRRLIAPSDPSSYFSVTFGSLVVLIKRQFDIFMEELSREFSDVRISKRSRVGILPTIDQFAKFQASAEKIFEGAERRTDLEKWYYQLYRSVCDGINKAANSPNSKYPASVVKFENYHELYLRLSELKISALDAQRKDAKASKEENIDTYVKEHMGRPLEKIHVIQQYPGKEVKKGLDQLYKKLEKHLVEQSSLLQVVWRHMQEQFLKQMQEYQTLIDTCYRGGAKIELEVSVQDVLSYFSEIAQQH